MIAPLPPELAKKIKKALAEHLRRFTDHTSSRQIQYAIEAVYPLIREHVMREDKDAERYRWLREPSNQGVKNEKDEGILVITDSPLAHYARYIGPLFGGLLDAKIDSAMKEGT